MNPYVNEEVMWQRLKDLQMEAENRRQFATYGAPSFAQLVPAIGRLVQRGAHAIGLAPRWWAVHEVPLSEDAADAHVA
jgi:hypothetical protein